jgi:hypothetical protein
MSTNALRGKGTVPVRPGDREIAIGDADHEIFNCPVCQRPLATGAPRCPGCGTRLLMGVQARKATALIGTGVMTGALVGGLIVALILLAFRPTTSSGPIVIEDPQQPAPSAGSTPREPIPNSVANALVRTSGLNARMAGQLPALSAAIKPTRPNSSEIARVLRVINSDAGLAAQAVPALAAWSEGRILAAELGQYYSDVRATATAALEVTLNNASAYRRNGSRMVALLQRIDELQAAAKTLGDANGIELGL